MIGKIDTTHNHSSLQAIEKKRKENNKKLMHQIENTNTNQQYQTLEELDRICKPDRKKKCCQLRKSEIESRKRECNREELWFGCLRVYRSPVVGK